MSQDLFAAFGAQNKAPSKQSGPARHNPAGPPEPLNLEAILNAKPYDEFTTAPVSMDEDDDEFGEFEDASPMDDLAKAAILKARMGSPLPSQEMPFFDTTPMGSLPSTKSQTTSQAPTASNSKPNLPFKPKAANPSDTAARPVSARKGSQPKSNLPFKPKPPQIDGRNENIGQHPFAGRMDMLFAGDDDDYDAGADDLNVDLANDPEAAMAYSKKLIADASAHERPQEPAATPASTFPTRTRQSNPVSKRPEGQSQNTRSQNSAVLFDADNVSEDDDDDWGTFETNSGNTSQPHVAASKPKVPVPGALGIDLLGLDDTTSQWASSETSQKAPEKRQSSRAPIFESHDDEAWDDFEDVAPAPTQAITSPKLPEPIINVTAPAKATTTPSLPPTNIPPPAVLLSIFPSLLASAQPALFDTLTKLPHDQKQDLLGHEATQHFLHGYIGLATVLAHVIAGRKQRWKRDQFLAQGMRIGPAAAGGKGGMKLAGVDKSEVAKEDREVLDAIRQWKAIVGKLRSAVVSANSKASTKLPPVPEISEQMPLKVLKPLEGGVVAPHACALCGLKREERVPKVDEGVDDSFGEWWVDGMNMHLLCKNFWDKHSDRMRSR